MSKQNLHKDEYYPYYVFYMEGPGREVEITAEELSDYLDVMERFEEWQEKLEKLYESAE